MAAFAAVPQAVEKVAKEMQSDGAEVRAGFAKNLGVFVVSAGNAPITGTKAKAKIVARAKAVQQLAGFLGSQISSSTRSEVSESTVNGQTEVKEFFRSAPPRRGLSAL